MRLALLWGLDALAAASSLRSWERKPKVGQFYFNLQRKPYLSLSFSLGRTEFKMHALGKRGQEAVPLVLKLGLVLIAACSPVRLTRRPSGAWGKDIIE